jgi:glycosyltransferase involved in cell wall biosynthesis
MSPNGSTVTASIACFGVNRYVRRAVESLLAQTHKELTVVVVNDGDVNPPWPELAHIRDPRLIRFSLEQNHGPYFVHQVVLAASDTPYFLIQDADDWSAANRVSALLNQLQADGSDLAFSAWQQYREDEKGALRPDSIRWRRREPTHPWHRLWRGVLALAGARRAAKASPQASYLFDPVLTDEFINRASHHGVFRRAALERIGGYYGGFRINHDTLLTNLLLMTGKVSFVEAPRYHYLLRRDSLSHSDATGARSPVRACVREQQAAIYREALHWRRKLKKRAIANEEFMTRVRDLATRFVTPLDREAVAHEAARLAAVMQRCAQLRIPCLHPGIRAADCPIESPR